MFCKVFRESKVRADREVESTGHGECPLPLFTRMNCDRRAFLAAGSVLAMTALRAGVAEAAPLKAKARRTIYRFSVRGRRASRAAKAFCANMRFKTKQAAMTAPPPHPGFNGRLIGVGVSITEMHRLFVSRHALVADLRQLRNLRIVGK